MKPPLIEFKCGCGYTETIGMDIRSGVVIKGSITLICPKCGAITHAADTLLLSPVQFMAPPRGVSTERGF